MAVADNVLWQHQTSIAARVEQVYTDSEFPRDANLTDVIERVAELHGKPIRVEPVGDEEWETLTGLWVEHAHVARILVRATDTQLYQTHCVLHELGHILLRHPGCRTQKVAAIALEHAADLDGFRGRLLSSSDPADAMNAVIEGEAEHLAHLLARSLFRPRNAADERKFA